MNTRHDPILAPVGARRAALGVIIVTLLALGHPAHAQVVTTTTSTTVAAPAPPPVVDDPASRLSGITGGVSQPDTDAAAPTTVAGASGAAPQPGAAPAGDAAGAPTSTVSGPAAGAGTPDPAVAPATGAVVPAGEALSPGVGVVPKPVRPGGASAPVALIVTLGVAAGLALVAARWFSHRTGH